MSANEAQALSLNIFDGFNTVEIAARLNITVDWSARLIRSARAKLKTAGVTLPPKVPIKNLNFEQIEDEQWDQVPEPKRLPRDLKPINSRLSA
jgi:predicted DNA-binding protein (UPF0251 family)